MSTKQAQVSNPVATLKAYRAVLSMYVNRGEGKTAKAREVRAQIKALESKVSEKGAARALSMIAVKAYCARLRNSLEATRSPAKAKELRAALREAEARL